MLGRHVYRVHPNGERWVVIKEGETEKGRDFASRNEAVAAALRLASGDQPSRVIVDNGDGIILEERLFGSDISQELTATQQ